MGAYEYKALDANGKETSGILEADTSRQIRQIIRDKGWMPLSVEEVQQKEEKQTINLQVSKIKNLSDTITELMEKENFLEDHSSEIFLSNNFLVFSFGAILELLALQV